MMTCREVAEKATAYLDSDLGTWEGLRLLVHLKLCSACGAFVGQIAQTDLVVRAADLSGELPPPDERIAALLRERRAAEDE